MSRLQCNNSTRRRRAETLFEDESKHLYISDMFVLLQHALSGRPTGVFWSSVLVFTVLNAVENLIHYSIGRGGSRKYSIDMRLPTVADASKMLGVMAAFALLQGLFTCALVTCR